MKHCAKYLILFILFSTVFISAAEKCFVYVSLRSSNAVKIFELNRKSGGLIPVDSFLVSGGPASMAVHPSKKYLYVAQREAKTISTFLIDEYTGKLSLSNTIKAVENPVYLSTDKPGTYLFTAYYAAGKIGVYPIKKNGDLNSVPVQVDSGYKTPHCILVDKSNKFLFVADKEGDKISRYLFNGDSGILTPNEPFSLQTPSGTGPRHIIFNNDGAIAYVVNENGNSVTSYSLESKTGKLSRLQTIKTLPDSFKLASKTADIHLTPDNKYLYASNRGHNSIAMYSVEEGKLNYLGTCPTEKNPRSFTIDSSGNYLLVTGESSDRLSAYRINKETGLLTFLYSIPIGKQPSWITTIEF